jgi:hypothetical protein
MFAMAFLPPATHPLWMSELRDGAIDLGVAAAVGDVLGRIHGATADRPDIALRFPTDDIFFAIRLEPYLVATARAHPDLAPRLLALVETTRATKRVLVHGDFSPKNLLAGPAGPVILDAECVVRRPGLRPRPCSIITAQGRLAAAARAPCRCVDALVAAYSSAFGGSRLAARTAARCLTHAGAHDGKSPVSSDRRRCRTTSLQRAPS